MSLRVRYQLRVMMEKGHRTFQEKKRNNIRKKETQLG